jgi:serine/threonine protein kinase/Tfp pilus assembly protein PilF
MGQERKELVGIPRELAADTRVEADNSASDIIDPTFRYDTTVRLAIGAAQNPSPVANPDDELPSVAGFSDGLIHQATTVNRLACARASFPEVGEVFLGFRLLALLGRGAFGKVYLAEQEDLAGRLVALKVAPNIFGESQTLAQLQHTNIVPIYSIHRAESFQAVCMPYFGATTLADVVQELCVSEALPLSGRQLVSTLNDRKAATRRSFASFASFQAYLASNGDVANIVSPHVSTQGADGAQSMQALAGMSYVNAVLWIFSRLADGLAHAHDRGILHRDIKPANVLLTDNGQPMLLDFNLSEDVKLRGQTALASIGGTLPYMSPEQIVAFRGGSSALEARSDVYSLGVILFELLTGKRLFPRRADPSADTLDAMSEDRQTVMLRLRKHGGEFSEAVGAILLRCLQPAPSLRYQSAHHLREDIERQLHDQPLKHAVEPWSSERLVKWCRRHPRLTSSTSLAAMLVGIIVFLAIGIVVRDRRLANFDAVEKYQRFQEAAETAQFKLRSRHADRDQLEEGIARGRDALGLYQVVDDPEWRQQTSITLLPEDNRARLMEDAGELLVLMAKATLLEADFYATATRQQDLLQTAEQFNRLAEECFGKEHCPKALLDQRVELAKRLGRNEEAGRYSDLAKQSSGDSAKDLYLIAHKQTIEGKYREALEGLRKTTQEDPRNFSAWFVRGNCYFELLQDAHAVACYNSCVVLRPEFHWSWFNRGLAHLRLRNYRQASDDFDQVLRLQPNTSDAFIHRAEARQGLKRYQDAIEDFTSALQAPRPSTRVYFLRAQARFDAGDSAGAKRDFDLGIAADPTDEAGWIARGLAKQNTDLAGALADFEQALKLNPRSFEGWQNKAAALDRLGKEAESLAATQRSVELYPESVLAIVGRGVLLARKNKRDQALEDAKASLLLDTSPSTLYMVACIYSLTSVHDQNDRLQALQLLSSALRGGYGLEIVESDSDLNPLRQLDEFKRMVAAAKTLATGTTAPSPTAIGSRVQ